MLRRLAITAMLLAATTSASQAADVEIAVSDKMAELLVTGRTAQSAGQSNRLGGGVLYNEDDDILANLFFQVNNRGAGRWQPVTFGLGAKLVAADLDIPDEVVGGLAIGGDIGIGIPASIPMAVVLQGYLSPNITTFGDAERYTEAMLRLEAELTRGAYAFVGLRQIKIHSDDFRDVKVDDGVHAGIRLRF